MNGMRYMNGRCCLIQSVLQSGFRVVVFEQVDQVKHVKMDHRCAEQAIS